MAERPPRARALRAPAEKAPTAAKKTEAIAGELILVLANAGWTSHADALGHAAEICVKLFGENDTKASFGALRRLDRTGAITPKEGPNKEAGWEPVLTQRRENAKRYEGFSAPFRYTMVFRTSPLGQVSNNDHDFTFERDGDRRPMFNLAQFHSTLQKAWQQAYLYPDEKGLLPSQASVRRWRVEFVEVTVPSQYDLYGLDEDAAAAKRLLPLPIRTRRPINEKGQAVGVCLHEALPAGSTAVWIVSWPTSHWTDINALALLDAAGRVGFSPAGSGRMGGNRGVYQPKLARADQELLMARTMAMLDGGGVELDLPAPGTLPVATAAAALMADEPEDDEDAEAAAAAAEGEAALPEGEQELVLNGARRTVTVEG
jgi:hypothetical protein